MDKLDFYRQLIQEQLLARAQLRSPQIDHNLLGTLNNGLPTVLLIHKNCFNFVKSPALTIVSYIRTYVKALLVV
jgi:hypothetical protein